MTVRIYLRASTSEADALRAREYILEQALLNNLSLLNSVEYIENYSGRKVARPELTRLLSESSSGDIILVEQIDRLTRLTSSNWKTLRSEIEQKGLKVVACDVATSFKVLEHTQDEMQQRVLESVNSMLIEILAATASKDYEDRRRRQREGIEKAKNHGKFKGRQANPETAIKCEKVHRMVNAGVEKLPEALKTYNLGRATYYRWKSSQTQTTASALLHVDQ
ncbi:recombinase family protein [Vibrio sp. ZSDZ65]|uniref:Recombinase family protein n=1 Tax=Vibrio qingdaonensis TaxID=2829491 RepID=A0A9X3HVX3_9VIBR|nr:recombinase family protein [Vibrio qingdaonensis]MCW8346025.1 recombinase family protein [Vibrio qingdaonensis]